jgi:hypothetical protein
MTYRASVCTSDHLTETLDRLVTRNTVRIIVGRAESESNVLAHLVIARAQAELQADTPVIPSGNGNVYGYLLIDEDNRDQRFFFVRSRAELVVRVGEMIESGWTGEVELFARGCTHDESLISAMLHHDLRTGEQRVRQ